MPPTTSTPPTTSSSSTPQTVGAAGSLSPRLALAPSLPAPLLTLLAPRALPPRTRHPADEVQGGYWSVQLPWMHVIALNNYVRGLFGCDWPAHCTDA